MAHEQNPAEEPIVSAEASDGTADPRPATGAQAIPDAEVVEDRPILPPRPEPQPAERPVAAPPPRRSGAFIGFLLGGAIAAAGGFALARYLPNGWPSADTSALTAQLQQQEKTMAELRQQVEALGARQTPDIGAELAKVRSELDARLAALPAPPDPAALADQVRSAADGAVSGLRSRLAALESRPAGIAAAGAATAVSSAYDQQLQALRDELAAQRGAASGASDELKAMAAQTQSMIADAKAEAEKLKAEAEAAGAAAMARAALGRIHAAVDGGGPFGSAVTELSETGHEVPAVLADAAASGIPTLPDLQRSYPAAARAALDAALRADMGESWTERATAFLRTQTGARSLTPLEGNDPDAILSRAEAALNQGQLAPALAELGALPDAAKVPLSDWIAAAEQREAAIAALASLSTALNAE